MIVPKLRNHRSMVPLAVMIHLIMLPSCQSHLDPRNPVLAQRRLLQIPLLLQSLMFLLLLPPQSLSFVKPLPPQSLLLLMLLPPRLSVLHAVPSDQSRLLQIFLPL